MDTHKQLLLLETDIILSFLFIYLFSLFCLFVNMNNK